MKLMENTTVRKKKYKNVEKADTHPGHTSKKNI